MSTFCLKNLFKEKRPNLFHPTNHLEIPYNSFFWGVTFLVLVTPPKMNECTSEKGRVSEKFIFPTHGFSVPEIRRYITTTWDVWNLVNTARWAPTSYKWSYKPYKWPYSWVTGVITPITGVITILTTGRGPILWDKLPIYQLIRPEIYYTINQISLWCLPEKGSTNRRVRKHPIPSATKSCRHKISSWYPETFNL